MSDFENDIFNLEGDALDEALLAAIEATDEEARLEREERIRKNQERAEQARITAIEQDKEKAKIDELRKNLPNEGRRYFLMAEEAECSVSDNNAVITGVLFGTCKKDDEVFLYRTDGKVLGTKILSIESFNGQVYEPADEVSSNKARITFTVDYEKTGFNEENAVPKFSVLTSVKPQVKSEPGKLAIENPVMSGLMFRYPDYKSDRDYLARLMDSIANGKFLVPAMTLDGETGPDGKKKIKIIMVTKKEDPEKRSLPLFTDLQALYLWRKLFEGEKKPTVVVMNFPDAAKFVSKDGFDIIFNPSGPVSFGLPFKAVKAMNGVINKAGPGGERMHKEIITDASKVVVGEPRPGEETDNLRKAIVEFSKNRFEIKKAGLMIVIRNNQMHYLVIADLPRGSAPDTFKEMSEAMKPYLKEIKAVDFTILSEAPFAKEYFARKEWDYKRSLNDD